MARITKIKLTDTFVKLEAEKQEHGERNDCAVKATVLVTGKPYKVCLDALRAAGRKPRQGAWTSTILKVMKELGAKTEPVDPQSIIKEYPGIHSTLKHITTHHPRRFAKVWPEGTYVLFMVGHVAVVKDGVLHDWTVNRTKRVTSIYRVK